MLVSLYDEMIDSILHIIDRLDLSIEKEKAHVRSVKKIFFRKRLKTKQLWILSLE